MLDPSQIVPPCADAGVPWSIRSLDECDSTNEVALDAVTADQALAAGGLAVFSDWQTAGRGRRGRQWQSEPGKDLLFSIAFAPALPPSQWGRYTHAAALGVVRALAPEFETSVKWPNDIYLGGEKLAGILLESRTDATEGGVVVIGIGLNVNTPADAFASDLDHPATSLCAAAGTTEVDREPIATALLIEIHRCLGQAADDFPALLDNLTDHSLLIGREIEWTDAGGTRRQGVAQGFGPEGELRFQQMDSDSSETLNITSAERIRLR